MRKYLITLLLAVCLSSQSHSSLANVTLAPFVSGLSGPVDIANAGDNSGRLFIVEQGGRIRVVQNGILLPTPFLNLTGAGSIVSTGGERGLLGLAFHPQYASNGQFFVYFTGNGNAGAGIATGDIVIARYERSADPNIANAGSRVNILTIPHPGQSNHNGGALRFGPDGFLYAGVGDGGGSGDPLDAGQNLNTLLGKILRLDVTGAATYTIPPTNPFAAGGGRPEIWAYGIRNPWRFSFDRGSGDFYIGDVGQNAWEEVNRQVAGSSGGANYGWRIREGNHCFNPMTGCVLPPNYVAPYLEYSHSVGSAVTGGYVYNGLSTPDLAGKYVFGDYQDAKLFVATGPGVFNQIAGLTPQVSSFGEGETGELYLADITSGTISSFSSSTDTTPDAVVFFPVSSVPVNNQTESNRIRVSGLGASTGISVSNGQYSIAAANSATCSNIWLTSGNTVPNDAVVCVRHMSASTANTSRTTTLTIGTTSTTFTSTTQAALPTFNVTPSAGPNGFISPTDVQTIAQGGTVFFTVTPLSGYAATVGGTCGGNLNGTNYTTNPVTADCTVAATFTLLAYAVTPSAGANGSIAPDTVQSVNHGGFTTFTITPSTGYSASVGGTCSGSLAGTLFTTGAITAPCSVAATFTLNSYTVTASAGANGTISPSGAQSISHGTTATFTVTPDPGYSASVGGSCGGSLAGTTYTTSIVTGPCTVTASFALVPVAPGAPVIGSAVAGDTQASISFTPPTFNGGAAITQYTVVCSPGGGPASGATSPITVSSLANNVLHTCSVTATNSAGTGPASAGVDVTPVSGAPLALVGVKSRKRHGTAGDFDLPVDRFAAISDPLTVEPRLAGAGHTIVFEFNVPITASGSAVASNITAIPLGMASTVADGNNVIVTLTGIADNQRLTLTLNDVNSPGFTTSVAMAFLVGDLNGSQGVNAGDISAVKARQGVPLDNTIYLADVNVSGAVDGADVSAVKARSGQRIP